LIQTLLVLATNEPLLRHGEGLAIFTLVLSGLCFLITRKGLAGARRTGPANYSGGMYIGLLVLRWVLLAAGLVGVGLIIVATI